MVSAQAQYRTIIGDWARTSPHAGSFCYFGDIPSILRILEAGSLLCRDDAEKENAIISDIASHYLISQTASWVRGFVRLYFAPRTPMLFDVEGIKQIADSWPKCYRPAYLVFDPDILCLPGVRISDRNMKEEMAVWQDATPAWLRSLPYRKIYHRGPLGGEYAIKHHRQAEVLIPSKLSTDYVRKIVFRSNGEYSLAMSRGIQVPPSAAVQVDKSWFYADQEYRMYLDEWETAPQHRMRIAHAMDGDRIIALKADPSGRRLVLCSTAHNAADGQLEWTPFNEDKALHPSKWPNIGRISYGLFREGLEGRVLIGETDAALPLPTIE